MAGPRANKGGKYMPVYSQPQGEKKKISQN